MRAAHPVRPAGGRGPAPGLPGDFRHSPIRTQPRTPRSLEGALRRRDERRGAPVRGDAARLARLRRPGRAVLGPGSFASGNYAVSSTIFLFPEGDPDQSGSTRLDSSFGLFVAGDGLEGAAPGYLAFEIRNDGQFRVAEHSGGKENDLVSWTGHDAVETLAADATDR